MSETRALLFVSGVTHTVKPLALLLNNLTELPPAIASIQIDNITNDSRQVTKNTLFLAYKGEKSDGRNYIKQAIAKGAVAICYDNSDCDCDSKVPLIPIFNLKTKQSLIAARFYDFPSKKIPVIGVTGTNGKTSITHFIAQIGGKSCGIIGTIGYGFLNHLKKTANTTPDGLQLQKILSELIEQGAQMVAMEVSSHALDQQRVNDMQFHTAVFTNLTQDHLDYHITMEKYRDAKELLFQQPELKNAVINIDNDAGKYYAEKYKNKLNVITYSKNNKDADIYAEKCIPTQQGFDLVIKTLKGKYEFHLPLIGEFNVENVLAVAGVFINESAAASKHEMEKLSQLTTVPGRMELVKKNPHVIIDYAHTPDALEKALHSIRVHCSEKVICVFGCGGNRDKTKRPKMGCIAAQLADYSIITNDNPRFENPESIAQEVAAGMPSTSCFEIILDRATAIQKAVQLANKNDWILIAGKGHETEQIIGDQVLHHSDHEVVLSI